MGTTSNAVVIGAGVIGLSTAIRLQEAGWRVRIRAERMPRDTTSMAAGALCGMAFAEPMDKVSKWDAATQRELARLADLPDSGVRFARGLLASRSALDVPAAMKELPGFALATDVELPAGFAGGFWLRLPTVDMPRYLDHLTDRFLEAGGEITPGRVDALAEIAPQASVLVNCSGVGARTLADDTTVVASRGQHVVVSNPGLEHFFMEGPPGAAAWASFVPHGDQVVLGGVAEEDNWSTEPDPATAERILERCVAVEPRLAAATTIEHRVGLRPVRPAIRVEEQPLGTTRCIHSYGHGGLGVMVSWGCADEVVELAGSAPT